MVYLKKLLYSLSILCISTEFKISKLTYKFVSGALDKDEFIFAFTNLGFPEDELYEIFENIDKKNIGLVSYD